MRERGGGVLTQASGYNFPLFLVYPVDMPGVCVCVCVSVCLYVCVYWHIYCYLAETHVNIVDTRFTEVHRVAIALVIKILCCLVCSCVQSLALLDQYLSYS